MQEGFSVGNRVDCSLTGLAGREGLWHALYPGTVIELVPDSDGLFYFVALDNFLPSILLKRERLSHQREDRCITLPAVGEMVHVLEYDKEVPVWWEAKVIEHWGAKSYIIRVQWLRKWVDHPLLEWIGLKKVRPAVAPEPLLELAAPILCKHCEKRPPFGKHKMCGACYVSDKVDLVMDALDERAKDAERPPPYYRWKHRQLLLTRALIVQQGGQSARRDKRLQKKLVYLTAWMHDALPEHPDEQAWEPDDDQE